MISGQFEEDASNESNTDRCKYIKRQSQRFSKIMQSWRNHPTQLKDTR